MAATLLDSADPSALALATSSSAFFSAFLRSSLIAASLSSTSFFSSRTCLVASSATRLDSADPSALALATSCFASSLASTSPAFVTAFMAMTSLLNAITCFSACSATLLASSDPSFFAASTIFSAFFSAAARSFLISASFWFTLACKVFILCLASSATLADSADPLALADATALTASFLAAARFVRNAKSFAFTLAFSEFTRCFASSATLADSADPLALADATALAASCLAMLSLELIRAFLAFTLAFSEFTRCFASSATLADSADPLALADATALAASFLAFSRFFRISAFLVSTFAFKVFSRF